MTLAATTNIESLPGLLATLPLWPLLGTLLVGVMMATGRFKQFADRVVVGGVALAAVIAIAVFLSARAGGAHAEVAHAFAQDSPVVVPVSHAQHEASASQEPSVGAHANEPGRPAPSLVKTYTVLHWISLGLDSAGRTRWLDVNFYVDGLTGIMLLVVTVISTLVVIYSIGYMKDHHGHKDAGYERFFAWLGLFVFSMCMLVLAGNFVLLYLGWEAVGLCSYLLIGHYYEKPSAAAAAKKAFIVNRIGDFGFALGIFVLYWFLSPIVQPGENPLDYAVAFKYAHHLKDMTLGGWDGATLVGLLLFCGAVGKSAQFPLYVWLPDAMEGPSPVSALIHAATMVTAGVYMVARCGPIYADSPFALDVITWVGLIGAVLAATMAMAQHDMKRILAYSTMSQLAFMFVALGCGSPNAAIFHLYTHAFFKALLFLSAGSVMHAMGNVIDLRQFSGLRSVLPQTYRLMAVGCLALAGFPLLAGFWSKDEIISTVMRERPWAGWILLATAGLTAYYTFRMFFLCFNGPKRFPKEAGDHPHDMPPVMIGPKTVLALGAVCAGFIGVAFEASGGSFLGFLHPHGFYHDYVANSTMVNTAHHSGAWLMYVSAAVALAGIGLAYVRYGAAPQTEPDQLALGPIWNLWSAKYYVDELYEAVFVRPLRRLGRMFVTTDDCGVDGAVWFAAAVPRALGSGARLLQRGALQGYALGMMIGLAILLVLWTWID